MEHLGNVIQSTIFLLAKYFFQNLLLIIWFAHTCHANQTLR